MVLVPGVLALLPQYAGLEDPVAELRAACVAAVRWLGADPVILADPQGERVARALLSQAGGAPATGSGRGTVAGAPPARVLVVGNGSARRTEKAPGFLDERSPAFDEALAASLREGRPRVDTGLAAELWASVAGIEQLAGLGDLGPAQVDYDDDPFGVQYWVMRWES